MIKIGLFCAAGFSTGMLVNNMRAAAKEKGIDVEISAFAQTKLQEHVCSLDVALLGPQVAYTYEKSKFICAGKNVPVAVIPMADYGMLDGKKVLEFALGLLEQK